MIAAVNYFFSLYGAILSLSYKRRGMPIITMFKRKLYVRPFDRFFRIAGLIKKSDMFSVYLPFPRTLRNWKSLTVYFLKLGLALDETEKIILIFLT